MLQEKSDWCFGSTPPEIIAKLEKYDRKAQSKELYAIKICGKEEEVPDWYFDKDITTISKIRRWWYHFKIHWQPTRLFIVRESIGRSKYGRNKLRELLKYLKQKGWMDE